MSGTAEPAGPEPQTGKEPQEGLWLESAEDLLKRTPVPQEEIGSAREMLQQTKHTVQWSWVAVAVALLGNTALETNGASTEMTKAEPLDVTAGSPSGHIMWKGRLSDGDVVLRSVDPEQGTVDFFAEICPQNPTGSLEITLVAETETGSDSVLAEKREDGIWQASLIGVPLEDNIAIRVIRTDGADQEDEGVAVFEGLWTETFPQVDCALLDGTTRWTGDGILLSGEIAAD